MVGEALEEEGFDLFSSGAGGRVEVGAVFAFAVFEVVEVFGFLDFVAVEEAGGGVGDVVVPAVAVHAREEFDAVAVVAGESGILNFEC